MEEALTESQTKLHEAHKLARIGIWEWIADSDTVYWSDELYEIAGRDKKLPAPAFREQSNLYTPGSRDRLSAAVEQTLKTGTPYELELEMIRPDGTSRWIRAFGGKKSGGEGKIRLYGTVQDITERKRAEDRLREYEKVVEGLEEMIAVVDRDYRYVIVNRAFLNYRNQERDQVIGRLVGYHSGQEAVMKIIKEKLDECFLDKVVKYAMEYTFPRFGVRDLSITYLPIEGPSGVDRVACVFQDFTERKRAEEKLRESEERFSAVFRASPVGTSITHLIDNQFVDVNDAFIDSFGYTREEVIGRDPLKLRIWADPEDRVKMVEILKEQGRIQDFETRCRRKSGEIIDVLVSAEIIEVAGQEYLLNLIHDVTERKQAQAEKEKLEAQLFQAQKMESVGRLAGGVAHDFNNMLGVIIGRAEMALEHDVLTDELKGNLQEIHKVGLRSADLTRQLLAFARKQTAIPKILDLNDTISGMLKMLRRIIGEDIDLSWQPGLDLWQVKIDPSQIDQILANLSVNARDAISGTGAITMRTENVVIDDSVGAESPEFIQGDYVRLTVSDTGLGMSEEVCRNIFEPFFTTKEVGKGTGLGLSTVYGIVKQNDGFIYVESEPGKGTTFKIYLPRFKAETAEVPSKATADMRPTGTETILLVEDDEAVLNLTKMILDKLGYTVLAAQTPGQAIDLASAHPGDLDLLITDVVMPEMHGRELAEKLGAVRPNLKCLYMSGYTADVITHRGILDEGVNFIQKPFRSSDFAAKLRQVLDQME
jgi:PAS domain S-box-containing protein